MARQTELFVEKRRILQLETLYDLSLALHQHQDEQQLIDELLERVCAVLDPAAAVAVTRDPYGGARAMACVGWSEEKPTGGRLLADPLWGELVTSGRAVERRDGELAGRPYRALLATPFSYRNVFLGYLALLDKEERGQQGSPFTNEDRRFLDSVAALAGVALDGVRQLAMLEAQRQKLAEENKVLRGGLVGEGGAVRVVAHAVPMRRVLDLVERVAPRSVAVLVRGESGTGKELIAKLLHLLSGRSGPLVALNCAALPESLLESELFGIEGGVATGVQARAGKFELADRGTLFLDEIGDMQPSLQAKLLRAIQEREILRLGGERAIPVDVRLVTATHRHLESLVRAGTFREDLYYRIKGIELDLPPLRERRSDIPHLVRHFAEAFCRREHLAPRQFTGEALALLLAHAYPGNVRELQNVVEGAISLASEETIDADLVRPLLAVPVESPIPAGPAAADDRVVDLATLEDRHIGRVLELTRGNKSEAAKLLGVSRRTLLRKGY
jgi:transcriptional regulator with GAF, ATPase, and Fis domain